MPEIPKTLTVATQKGGVGKTFLNTNIAALLASRGLKTLLIDADPESCSTSYPTA
ncbi:MAG: ParA family protein [Oligoflexia bacterium]|nr:ParA family protein [Oligoflexia bacterium]